MMQRSVADEARAMLERAGVDDASALTSGNLVEIANMIASRPVRLDDSDRQMVLLALATLALDRPGLDCPLARIATEHFAGGEMFRDFKRFNADRFGPSGRVRHVDGSRA